MEEKLKKLKQAYDSDMASLSEYLKLDVSEKTDYFFDYMTGRISGLRYAISVLEEK